MGLKIQEILGLGIKYATTVDCVGLQRLWSMDFKYYYYYRWGLGKFVTHTGPYTGDDDPVVHISTEVTYNLCIDSAAWVSYYWICVALFCLHHTQHTLSFNTISFLHRQLDSIISSLNHWCIVVTDMHSNIKHLWYTKQCSYKIKIIKLLQKTPNLDSCPKFNALCKWRLNTTKKPQMKVSEWVSRF